MSSDSSVTQACLESPAKAMKQLHASLSDILSVHPLRISGLLEVTAVQLCPAV